MKFYILSSGFFSPVKLNYRAKEERLQFQPTFRKLFFAEGFPLILDNEAMTQDKTGAWLGIPLGDGLS